MREDLAEISALRAIKQKNVTSYSKQSSLSHIALAHAGEKYPLQCTEKSHTEILGQS